MSDPQTPALPPKPKVPVALHYYCILCLLLVFLAWASWFFRYELHVTSSGESNELYRLDRWSGRADQQMYRVPFDNGTNGGPMFVPILEQ